MSSARRKAIVILGLTVAAAAGGQAWHPTRHLADTRAKIELDQFFPSEFAGWGEDRRMPVQLVSPAMQAQLDKIYNQTLSRTYVNPEGERIMLSVAYGGDQSDATRAHRPEVCYPAQGFQILESEIVELDIGQPHPLRVRRLLARQSERVEPITYWITVGERTTVTGTEQKLAQLTYSTRGLIPDGMLVRVSSIDRDTGHAYAVQQRFIASLASAITADRRRLVVGRVAE